MTAKASSNMGALMMNMADADDCGDTDQMLSGEVLTLCY